MSDLPAFPLRVFYDGSCAICAAEIEHYLDRDRNGSLQAVDVHSPDFDPQSYQIPRSAFMYELHAIDARGRVYRGVEAFRAIWQAFPGSTVYGVMAAVISLPLINPAARLCYRVFARLRPFLPKNHSCSNGSCRSIPRKQGGDAAPK